MVPRILYVGPYFGEAVYQLMSSFLTFLKCPYPLAGMKMTYL